MIRTGYFSKKRSRFLYLLLLGFVGIIARLVYLQLFHHEHYNGLAQRAHKSVSEINCERGGIYDRNGKILAESHISKSIWADPKKVDDLDKLEIFLEKAESVLSIDKNMWRSKCKKKNRFVWLKRSLTFEQEEKIALAVEETPGVYFRNEWGRFYPSKSMLSPFVGVVGVDHKGLTGLEARYNNQLKGETGKEEIIRDAKRRVIHRSVLTPPVKGNDVYLTIDLSIQTFLHQELSRGYEEHKPKTASGIVVNALTGEILAVSTLPSHTPGDKIKKGLVGLSPRVILDVFEPGSTMKPLVYAAFLERNKGTPEEEVHCGHGAKKFGSRTLHDVHGYGDLSFKDIIVKSSNIGAAIMGERIGRRGLYETLDGLGFGHKCYLPITGEPRGMLRPLNKWSSYSMSSLPMGHEISVTIPQMVRAYCAIANGGYVLQTYMEKGIKDPNGNMVKENGRMSLQRMFSKKTCRETIGALEEVVLRGTAKKARSSIYRIAGKTGTTEKIVNGEYVKDKNIGSFICIAPASNPKIVVMIVMDEPTSSSFGGVVAAPVAKRVVEDTLQYMGVPVDVVDEEDRI